MEAKPRVEVGDFLGISIASVIVSSLELRHCPKDKMFGRDKGFKCPNLPWTAPDFQAMKGIIHAPCAKPALRPESRDAPLTAIANARGWITDIRLGHELEWPALFAARSGGEPTPSLDLAGLSRRSTTGSRSSEGSILTRRDASPDFTASAIIRAMDAFARGGNQSRIKPQSFYRSHLKPGMIPEGTGTKVANLVLSSISGCIKTGSFMCRNWPTVS